MKNLLSRLKARAASLWAREPVLVASAGPLLVTLGVLTQVQASTLTTGVAGVVAVGAQLVAAFGVRHKVSSPATAAALEADAYRAASLLAALRRRNARLPAAPGPEPVPVVVAPAPAAVPAPTAASVAPVVPPA